MSGRVWWVLYRSGVAGAGAGVGTAAVLVLLMVDDGDDIDDGDDNDDSFWQVTTKIMKMLPFCKLDPRVSHPRNTLTSGKRYTKKYSRRPEASMERPARPAFLASATGAGRTRRRRSWQSLALRIGVTRKR